jgi:anti-sigma regulatory factor (Ser/Thr protein kinase)
VPLNRPALALGPGPRGVQDARRWVSAAFTEIRRHDLAECAELGASELVTNALLHGTPPIRIAVRGTREHPRVEVRDASVDRPVLPSTTDPDDLDEVLLTFGRGLSIVARASTAWGAEMEDDGKVVWFAPATEVSEEGTDGVITGAEPVEQDAADDDGAERFEISNVPVTAYTAFQRHYRELRREVRLLALAHEEDYPLAKTLSDLFGSLEKPLRRDLGADQVEAARAAGATHVDLHVALRTADVQRVGRLIELLDLADAFCREERLLSLARTPEQQTFQHWFLGEVVRQSSGGAPKPWSRRQAQGASGSGGAPLSTRLG